ncbi:MAG: diguanylate cyclase [Pseudomonadales bacterium]|nr:diguanylate cyclase [Pseudomonadales bacterium]
MSDKYKEKYTRLLDELDEQEKQHSKQLQLLHSQIVRICSQFSGKHAELDEAISLLPKYIDPDNLPTEKLRLISELLLSAPESSSNATDEVRTNLAYLLENLPPQIDSHLDRAALLKNLEEASEPEQFLALIDQLENQLALTLLAQDKQVVDLSKFLEEIASRLDGFKNHLDDEDTSRTAQTENHTLLTDRVSQHVFDIRESVADSSDLDSLKQAVQSRLDEIDTSVESLIKTETERAEKAEKANAKLRQRTQKLTQAAKQLQTSLKETRQQAIEDSLTGIPNRRAYEERLELEYKRWKRTSQPFTLAILDIDKFKYINDTFGHPVGDKVLKSVATFINSKVRESDFFGRVGGEEFVILLIGSDLDQAEDRLQKLRKGIDQYKFGYKGKEVPVTMSIGYAQFRAEDAPNEVYQRADEALLRCKQTGRNKCLPEA